MCLVLLLEDCQQASSEPERARSSPSNIYICIGPFSTDVDRCTCTSLSCVYLGGRWFVCLPLASYLVLSPSLEASNGKITTPFCHWHVCNYLDRLADSLTASCVFACIVFVRNVCISLTPRMPLSHYSKSIDPLSYRVGPRQHAIGMPRPLPFPLPMQTEILQP